MNRSILCLVLAVLFSCSKKYSREEATPSGLVINLSTSALQIQNIDSADVVFRKTGTSETVEAKFVKHESKLSASLQTLSPGPWNADVEVYTKTVNLQSNQYKIIQSIQVTNQKNDVEIAGPGATSGNGWLKRMVKASTGNEVVVIVPDDVNDPYFEFRAKANRKYAFGIQREAIYNNFVVAQKTWACTNTCLDANHQLTDIDQFMPFTQTIQSEAWTKNSISIAVLNEQMEIILDYDRTWLK